MIFLAKFKGRWLWMKNDKIKNIWIANFLKSLVDLKRKNISNISHMARKN